MREKESWGQGKGGERRAEREGEVVESKVRVAWLLGCSLLADAVDSRTSALYSNSNSNSNIVDII